MASTKVRTRRRGRDSSSFDLESYFVEAGSRKYTLKWPDNEKEYVVRVDARKSDRAKGVIMFVGRASDNKGTITF